MAKCFMAADEVYQRFLTRQLERCSKLLPEGVPTDVDLFNQAVAFVGFGIQHDYIILEQAVPSILQETTEVRRQVVVSAILDTLQNGNADLTSFKVAAAVRHKEWRRVKPQVFTVWIHLDVSSWPPYLNALKLLGTDVEVVQVSDVEFAFAKLEQGKPEFISESVDFLFKCQMKARSGLEAITEASEVFELLRGAMNCAAMRTSLRISTTATAEFCRHYPPQCYIAISEAGDIFTAPSYLQARATHHTVSEAALTKVEIVLSHFRHKVKEGSTKEQVLAAILTTGQGVDNVYPSAQFLQLWIALENLALVDSGNSHEVAKRISRLWASDGVNETKEILTVLAKKRNKFVHEGYFDHDDDASLSFLRWIVAKVIFRVIHLSPTIKTTEALTAFYSVSGQKRKVLDARAQGIEAAKLLLSE